MNRIRLLAIGTMLMFALTTFAQQTTTSSDAHGGRGGGVPTAQEQLKVDQKKKLDQYLQGPHPEMHANLSGATPPPRAPQI